VTVEDLTPLRDRLRDALLDEESDETRFSRLEDDYFESNRARARAAITDIVVQSPEDRERFLVAKEVYDLCDDLNRARWSKVRRLAVELMESESTTLPENLITAEREFLESTLRIREVRR
jgi:hypothetical protein